MPRPEEMVEAFQQAIKDGRWDHLDKDFFDHADDWFRNGFTRAPLTFREYSQELPSAVVANPHTDLCLYRYQDVIAWGYYCRKIRFKGETLMRIGMVFDSENQNIFHLMYLRRGDRYFEQYNPKWIRRRGKGVNT